MFQTTQHFFFLFFLSLKKKRKEKVGENSEKVGDFGVSCLKFKNGKHKFLIKSCSKNIRIPFEFYDPSFLHDHLSHNLKVNRVTFENKVFRFSEHRFSMLIL